MPTVNLELESRPESLIVVRGMLVGVADFLGLDPDLVHALKTVVSEACNNTVLHAYEGDAGPLTVCLDVRPDGVEAVVRDWGRGIRRVAPSRDRIHVGLAVISTLADRAQFIRDPEGGTEVRMAFTGRPGIRLLESPPDEQDLDEVELSGDAIVTVSPPSLLGGVLGRVASGLASRASFSLERFCDVYLVSDAIATNAAGSAVGGHLAFAVTVREHRLELTVGPFRAGSGVELTGRDDRGPLGSALSLLAVELDVEPVVGAEMWRLVVSDRDGVRTPPARD